ncbi:HD family phosphohydrolase [Virgibacillus sp. MSP4-1]|uniref:HD family phosphohydrolase n=1 Tax=Virgibacillus sp. MSP4-1 TaxID=2700081 RepID=UPI0005C74D91|nr:HDIG domain-containing metalloprotein [Virgibacillus sp. MSP4-1]
MKRKFLRSIQDQTLMKSPLVWIVLCVLLTGVCFFVMASSNVQPQSYEIERFTEAKDTIYSPVTVEDQKETEAKIQRSVQAVAEQYTISDNVTEERLEYINEIFDAAARVNQNADEQQTDGGKGTSEDKENLLMEYESLLSETILKHINSTSLAAIIGLETEQRKKAQEFLNKQVRSILESGVRSSNLNQKQIEMNRHIMYEDFSSSIKTALNEIAEFAIVENSFFDAEKTAEQRQKAASNVEPVMIRAGEKLVEKGEIITNEIYDDLMLVGVLKNDRNLLPYIGLALLILILCSLLFMEWYKQNVWRRNDIFIIFLISIGTVAIMKVFSLFDSNDTQLFLAIPAAVGVMIVKWLISDRMAIMLAVIFAILGSILFNFHMPGYLNVKAGLFLLISQLTGIYLFQNFKEKGEILKTGLGLLVANVFVISFFQFISFNPIEWRSFLTLIGFGFSSAFLSTVLTLGLMPIFETGLNILTESKLLQLSNPNHPLLRKILIEAPGTYHHSVMVANLSEAACEAVGANGLLARVASYYHDLGKTVNPNYFIENQMGERNPHDYLTPEESAHIIIRHPYDGAHLLRKQKMPEEIIHIAEQHHGKSLLKYFYYKAKEMNEDTKESDYRYPGPKPQTKEAAIICICDSVEAAVRSINEPSMDKIEKIVKSIIQDKLMDNQLNDSPLTFNDLHRIETAIYEVLKGIFHSRIKYPEVAAREDK